MAFKGNIVNSMGKNGQFNRQREEIMKKLAVLTSFVFLFGVGSAAVADTVNYNDIVQGQRGMGKQAKQQYHDRFTHHLPLRKMVEIAF